ncbi:MULTISPECIES: YxeA family protein [Bacillus cereus group]|uniref:YxeA family protein n=1 Tax=Bacillus cereus group TaxID=86661 RepID=UPI0008FE1F2B|nr:MULTISPECIES: YxeA family protein [Bacillus cereus group]MDG1618950.1 YxeA family protein [Bacillus mobilis]MDX5841206.1 YxeA family protein [Bacillus cereus group sp. BfR-BA-01700]OJE36533.1 hypothetical protein BAQ44_00065 [Bacillus mobilis]HDR7240380.1 YxeA family protein [Bacillus mobilis]
MKKLLLGLIGLFIVVIGVASVSHNEITDRYNPLVKEDWLYVKAKESGRLSKIGEVAGDYKLTGYYASGEGKDVKFYAPRGLREGAYVKVKTKGEYIETYQEVQPNEIPKEIKEKLDK